MKSQTLMHILHKIKKYSMISLVKRSANNTGTSKDNDL